MATTFYEVLGVPEDAATEDIRAAYRARLKESHPDLSDDEDASERTKRIIRARDVLTDEDERGRYDRMGHAAYVGQSGEDIDESDVSSAASAAREAGWAEGASDDGRADRDEVGGRRRARERRRRERAARERVDAATDGHQSDGAATAETANGSAASAASASTDGSGTNVADGVSESDRSWNAGSTFSVRQTYDVGNRRRRLFPSTQSLVLLVVSFVLLPIMVFASLFPPFPLVVNLVVALCIVLLVGYLQSVPEVGVVVFGSWSVAMPFALAELGIPLTSLLGVLALTLTWTPFGLSVLTFVLVRDQL